MKILGATLLMGSLVFLAGAASAGPCDTDFNGDGVTDDADFEILQSLMGATEDFEAYSPIVDLNQDGQIDLADFTLFTSCN